MAQLPPVAVSAAYQLGFRRTQSLSAEQHLALLGYLCDELLDTHAVRDTLQSAPQASPKFFARRWITAPPDDSIRALQAVHSTSIVYCICAQRLAQHLMFT